MATGRHRNSLFDPAMCRNGLTPPWRKGQKQGARKHGDSKDGTTHNSIIRPPVQKSSTTSGKAKSNERFHPYDGHASVGTWLATLLTTTNHAFGPPSLKLLSLGSGRTS